MRRQPPTAQDPSPPGPLSHPLPSPGRGSVTLAAIFLFSLPALGQPNPGAAPPSTPWFTDRAAAAGIEFVHFNGMSGEFYFSEIVGSGGALFDYDGDGDLDVYLVQGHMLGPGKTFADAVSPPVGQLRDRLFRNDLVTGAGGSRLRFTEVTEESGIRALGYGMG
ncbi:MAG: hypothetical protein V3T72_00265, partial [Thermoanaerobaculia bacterium]